MSKELEVKVNEENGLYQIIVNIGKEHIITTYCDIAKAITTVCQFVFSVGQFTLRPLEGEKS